LRRCDIAACSAGLSPIPCVPSLLRRFCAFAPSAHPHTRGTLRVRHFHTYLCILFLQALIHFSTLYCLHAISSRAERPCVLRYLKTSISTSPSSGDASWARFVGFTASRGTIQRREQAGTRGRDRFRTFWTFRAVRRCYSCGAGTFAFAAFCECRPAPLFASRSRRAGTLLPAAGAAFGRADIAAAALPPACGADALPRCPAFIAGITLKKPCTPHYPAPPPTVAVFLSLVRLVHLSRSRQVLPWCCRSLTVGYLATDIRVLRIFVPAFACTGYAHARCRDRTRDRTSFLFSSTLVLPHGCFVFAVRGFSLDSDRTRRATTAHTTHATAHTRAAHARCRACLRAALPRTPDTHTHTHTCLPACTRAPHTFAYGWNAGRRRR